MGIRGELFSKAVQLNKRTYFFNVKENRMGDLYLNIVESRNKESGGFERQSLVLFAEDLKDFLSGMDAALKVMEKVGREKEQSVREKQKNREVSGEKTNLSKKSYSKKRENPSLAKKPVRTRARPVAKTKPKT